MRYVFFVEKKGGVVPAIGSFYTLFLSELSILSL